jgi:membrane-bound lytic murein transglycosylase D
MNTRRLLFIVMVTGFCAVARGNQLNTIAAVVLNDTNVLAQIGPKSSLIIKSEKKNSSENGFKDLFIVSSMGGSNGAKLNPRAVSFVQDYVDRNGKELQNMKDWGRPYFSLIDNILTSYGLPRELKYLAVIESQLKPNSVSWAGAVGPWQLMPTTARVLGLKVTRRYDERTNYYKSTRAAAKYLRDLYNELGDWLLVIAAYNGGTAHVYNAMRRSGSHDFWNLQYYLPAESRNHVKKFIGTHYVFEGQGGITTLTKDEATEQLSGSSMYVFNRKLNETELINSKTNSISGKYYSSIIAKYILMDQDEFNRYNPDFDKVMASANNTYDLTLPSEKMDLFVANKYQILNESVQLLLNGVSEADSANQKISNNAIAKRDKK